MNQKLIEQLAVKSLVEHRGELIFSKEKFAKLIIKETLDVARAGVEFGDGMDSAVERYFEIKL